MAGNCINHSPSPTSGFFRILLPGFSKGLAIPAAFVKRIRKDVTFSKSATILNPNGKSWRVDIYRHKQVICMGGGGWKELVRVHNLRHGYFLQFRYRGNMVFKFRAYDESTCEIRYPRIIVNKIMKNKYQMESDDDDDDDDDHKPWSTKEEDVPNSEEARFESTMGDRSIRKNYVYIPVGFRASAGLRDKQEVILRDSKGRTWTVLVRFKISKQQSCYLSNGWLDFVRDNDLKNGDRCSFVLVPEDTQGNTLIIHVKIQKHGVIPEPTKLRCTTTMEQLQSLRQSKDEAWFETTVTEHNIRKNYLYIPVGFKTSAGLQAEQEVILRESKDRARAWSVRITFKKLNGKRRPCHFANGWLNFVGDNELKKGDKCCFELVPAEDTEGDKLIIQVKIHKYG